MAVADLRRELERLIDRLQTLGTVRLGARYTPRGGTVADAVHELAQLLADAAAHAENRPPRRVPRLADHAAADLLTVVGRDTLDVLARAPEASTRELLGAVVTVRRGL